MTNPAQQLIRLQTLLQTVKSAPHMGQTWLDISELADEMGQSKLAWTAAQEATRQLASHPHAWFRYGLALSKLDRDEEAVEAYRQALSLDPTLMAALVNLCISFKNLGRFKDAETALRQALTLSGQTLATDEDAEKSYTVLHWHLALLELVVDDYIKGFAHFRARFHGGTNWIRNEKEEPLWRGEDLQGRTLRVTAEQGHGDTLMMARYLPLLKERGASVIFQPHPALTRYLSGWQGADDIVAYGTSPARHADFQVPIFDLPYRFQTSFETLPASVPYLPVPSNPSGIVPRSIGLIYAGQPDNVRDKSRSLSLIALTELFELKDYRFHNLTRDLKSGDTDILARYGVHDHSPDIHDFADSARLIAAMDLIITCDTATAHLAGGMGRPVWVLLPFSPDWRWGLERETCPWYPTMRLFRQKIRGDWSDVMKRVHHALESA